MPQLCSVRLATLFLSGVLAPVLAGRAEASEKNLDLSAAVLVTPPGLSGPERKAVNLLADEVEKRTRVRWRQSDTWPSESVPVIAVGRAEALHTYAAHFDSEDTTDTPESKPEGYQIRTLHGKGGPVVRVAGNDARGVLFGVGRLLRTLVMEKGKVTLPAGYKAAGAPRYPLRGHQLGYRPKTNSYDGWDVRQWEQYIRDLAVFGANSIELLPPKTDDAGDSPHFPRPPMEMLVAMSRLCDEYGLDVWLWYPALDKDYSDPKTVEAALKEWGAVFARLPRVDAVFVPGGDPGHTRPRYLMELLEKQAEVLHRSHPKATLWVSPQGFSPEWINEFLATLKAEPTWLTGIVYGPGTRLTLPQLRAAVPTRYPIRHYPDITHSRTSQYPMPDWDTAFAMTEGREPINPRPRGQARIFRLLQPHTNGFITYSEGCNDDLNKAVWSALGWDPEADVVEVLREYSRYFIGPTYSDGFAQGLLALERNWEGPVISNAAIYTTLQQFRDMERSASPQDLLNWRFQQALYRAYYDAYVRSRLVYETRLEDEAMQELRRARRVGSVRAMTEAEKVLQQALTRPVAEDWRARVFELGEALYQSVRMQLSVGRYQAINENRGANLDTIDRPLNDRLWLLSQFAEIRKIDSEAGRLKRIDEILNWTDPGPGGFYDDAGNPSRRPHLVRGPGADADPAFFQTVATVFEDKFSLRRSWWSQAMGHYDLPVAFRYTGLDPSARYAVRVVYGAGPIRLLANEGVEVHPFLNQPYERLEFPVPAAATAGGKLELRWLARPGRGGNGRGCQVAEVWLINKDAVKSTGKP
jgi:hypothetical protein